LRGLVFRSGKAGMFIAGADLKELGALRPEPELNRQLVQHGHQILLGFEKLPYPTVAAIEGACVGGGLEVALGCDLRVSSTAAKFGFPEVKIGMLPDLGGTTRLPRILGPTHAKEWILTGRQYSAQRAFELGLLNELTAPGQAQTRALALAKELASCAPLAVAWAKRVIDRGLQMPLRDSLELEQDAMTELLPSADLKEGILAFMEKRAPRFAKR